MRDVGVACGGPWGDARITNSKRVQRVRRRSAQTTIQPPGLRTRRSSRAARPRQAEVVRAFACAPSCAGDTFAPHRSVCRPAAVGERVVQVRSIAKLMRELVAVQAHARLLSDQPRAPLVRTL